MIKNKSKIKSKESKDKNDMWWGASLVGILYFALLINTAPRTNVGYADSDELLTVAYNLGVAHPSGYSIYILLLSLFLKLPIGEVAFRGHVFSIFCHSLTLSLVFAFLWKLASYLQKKNKELNLINKKIDKWILASLGSLVLGSNYLFWLYGEVAEKFSFSSLLIAIFLFGIIKIWDSKDKLKDWLWLGVVSGLMVGHHQTLVLLLPMVGVLFWLKRSKKKVGLDKKRVINFLLGLGVAIGLAVLALWGLNNNDSAQVSWNFPKNLDGLIFHVLRKDFAPTNPVTGGIGSAYLDSQMLGSNIIGGIPIFVSYSLKYFGFINLVMLILGVVLIWQKDRKLAYILGSGLVITMLFSAYVSTGDFNEAPSVVRQYLLSYTVMSVFMAMGWYMMILRLINGAKVVSNKKWFGYSLVGICLVILSLRLVKLYPQADLSNYDFVSRFHKQILEDLPEDSLLVCFTDVSCFALLYEQNVNGLREDVIILPPAYPLVKNRLESMENLKGYDYQDARLRTFDYITWNVGKRRIFLLDFDQKYYDMLGMAYGLLYYVPNGYIAELTKKMPEKLPPADYSYSFELKDSPAPTLDIMRKWINTMMPRIHFKNAAIYVKIGDREEARDQLNIASDILHQIPEIDLEQVEASREGIEGSYPIEIFAPGSESPSFEDVMDNVNRLYEGEAYSRAFLGALGALSYDPMNKELRLMIADIYEKQSMWKKALVEYQNIAKYHDDPMLIEKINQANDKIKYGI